MKTKLTLLNAILSTVCLTVGLTRLASQFDPVSRHAATPKGGEVSDSPDCQACNVPCEMNALNYGSFSDDSK